jgi:ABC-type amino acid transport substrate-binding protein
MPGPCAPAIRLRCSLLARVLFFWFIPFLAASASVVQPAPPDIQRIAKRGELVVALPAFDSPPFFSQRNGALRGLDIDLARGLAEALNVRVRFERSAASFNAVVDVIARGDADVAICKLSRTLARAARIRFSEPYLVLHHALAVNRLRFAELAHGQELATVIRHFGGRLGVIEGSSYADFAVHNFPSAKLVRYQDWDTLVAALKKGEIIAAYRDEFEVNRLLQSDPRLALTLRTVTLTDTEDSIGMAVPSGSSQLLALINLYLDQRPDKLTAEKVMDRLIEEGP